MTPLFYTKPFEYFFERIEKNEHFKYSRYNDGELIAIIGDRPHAANCDGHQYFPAMGQELKQALIDYKYSEDYMLESFDYWYNTLPHTRQILDQLKIINPELAFLNTDFIRIAHEQEPDKFLMLLELLKEKKLTIVGPEYLWELDRFFGFTHITIPVKNCYTVKDNVINTIRELNQESSDNFYLFSASMPTKAIIEAFKDDNKNTYLDWGSVWDTFFVSSEYGFIRKRSTSDLDKYKEIYKEYLI